MLLFEGELRRSIESELAVVRHLFVDPIMALAKSKGVRLDEINDWLCAVRAIERNAVGRRLNPSSNTPMSGVEDSEAEATINRLAPKGDALDAIELIVFQMMDYERKRIIESGLATREEVDAFVKEWGLSYLPLTKFEADLLRSRVKAPNERNRPPAGSCNPLRYAVDQVQKTIVEIHLKNSGAVRRIAETFGKDTYLWRMTAGNPGAHVPAFFSASRVHGRLWLLAATLAACIFAAYVWPTRYRYEHTTNGDGQSKLVRINRLTGRVSVLQTSADEPPSPPEWVQQR